MTTDAESRYDVALSFAGAQRVYVALVAERLRSRGVRVFYDEFYATAMIGQELISYLQQVYSHQSKAVAAFISADWVQKPYTTHERETALAYALLHTDRTARPYLLPFRFDDSPVPGLQPTVAYHDLRTLRPGSCGGGSTGRASGRRTPRTSCSRCWRITGMCRPGRSRRTWGSPSVLSG
jgi:hypothetical protein